MNAHRALALLALGCLTNSAASAAPDDEPGERWLQGGPPLEGAFAEGSAALLLWEQLETDAQWYECGRDHWRKRAPGLAATMVHERG